MDETRIGLAALEALAMRALVAAGTREAAARSVARALVLAEADGLASHGVARLPAYCAQLRAGKVDGRAEPKLERLGPAGARIDACCGFAYPALELATAVAAELAESALVGVVAVTNSHHFGVAGHHVERLAAHGLIGLMVGNSPAAMAPWGGRRALLGTNPIAFACPSPPGPPLVVDVSLSRVARGKVMLAAQRGESIPESWGLDGDGRPTADPQAVLAGGSMVPLGEAKGAALALMVEVLAGALTGANLAFEASSFFDAEGGPPRVGQLVIAIRPQPFAADGFEQRVATLLEAVEGEPEARVPGARRFDNRFLAEADGVAVAPELLDRIRRLADGLQGAQQGEREA